jgi:hypothetical protein
MIDFKFVTDKHSNYIQNEIELVIYMIKDEMRRSHISGGWEGIDKEIGEFICNRLTIVRKEI